MRIVVASLVRSAVCAVASAAFIAGCGGSQAPIGSTPRLGALPMNVPQKVNRSSSGDLLYVANEGEAGSQGMDVAVLTYPQGVPVTTITGIGPPWGICSDKSGNVWVVTLSRTVYEFAHGGTTPIAELQVPNSYLATGCSVDPTTGNLAVVNTGGSAGPSIDIWLHATGSPTIYPIGAWACSYDDKGNLFVDGIAYPLAELLKGGSAFTFISLNRPGKTYGGIAWDGKYIALEALDPSAPKRRHNVIYRVRVSGSTGTVVQTIHPLRLEVAAWIWVQGDTLIATVHGHGGSNIGFWHYPDAHEQFEKLSPFYDPIGITISVAPH
jgi:hypothetical protein